MGKKKSKQTYLQQALNPSIIASPALTIDTPHNLPLNPTPL